MKRFSIILLALLVFLAASTGCSTKLLNNNTSGNTTNPATVQPTQTPTMEKWNAVLYFSDKDAMHIIKEEREMVSSKKLDTAEKAKTCVEELVKGSKNKNLSASIPAKTKVLSVSIEKDTAVLDVSKEFVSDNVGGSAGETMALAPIVITLCSIEGIKQVSFKIEGKVQPDYKGHMTLDQPFKRSDFEQLLQK